MNRNSDKVSKKKITGTTLLAGFAVFILLLGFAAQPIASVFADNGQSSNARASTNATAGANANVNANTNANASSESTSSTESKKEALQKLREALRDDQQAFRQAVHQADQTYKQAVQSAELAHKDAAEGANDAYQNAVKQANEAYRDTVGNTHGNASVIASAIVTRDEAVNAAAIAKINATSSLDVARDQALMAALLNQKDAYYGALATRDGNDGTARVNFYTAINDTAKANQSDIIAQAHVKNDKDILAAWQASINSVEAADVKRDQSLANADLVYLQAQLTAEITRDHAYGNTKAWYKALATYENTIGPMLSAKDNAIASIQATHATDVGNADGIRDIAIVTANANMYTTIAGAYS